MAISDADMSNFACYEFGGTLSLTELVAESFLLGPVQTAEVEIQDDGVVIALAVGAR